MSTYSLTLRQLTGPSGSTIKGAKLSISEVDGNFIYLQNIAASASTPNGTPIKDQYGNVIFDPVNLTINSRYYNVIDFSSCFPFMPQELSIGASLYVGGPWGSTTSDTQEAHKAIGWDSGNYRNIFYGDGSQLVNLPSGGGTPSGNQGYIQYNNMGSFGGSGALIFDGYSVVSDGFKGTMLDSGNISSVNPNDRILDDENGTHAILWNTSNSALRFNGSTKFDWKNLSMPPLGGQGAGLVAVDNSGNLSWSAGGPQGPAGSGQGAAVFLTIENANNTVISTTASAVFISNDQSSTAFDLTLPTVSAGYQMTIIRIDNFNSENFVTVYGPFFGGGSSYSLNTSGVSMVIMFDGTVWHILSTNY